MFFLFSSLFSSLRFSGCFGTDRHVLSFFSFPSALRPEISRLTIMSTAVAYDGERDSEFAARLQQAEQSSLDAAAVTPSSRIPTNLPLCPSIAEECLSTLFCFYRLSKTLDVAFNPINDPAFLHKAFGPFLCNKLSRTNEDIYQAVDAWCSDPTAAEERYGHISEWDTYRVTIMDKVWVGHVCVSCVYGMS